MRGFLLQVGPAGSERWTALSPLSTLSPSSSSDNLSCSEWSSGGWAKLLVCTYVDNRCTHQLSVGQMSSCLSHWLWSSPHPHTCTCSQELNRRNEWWMGKVIGKYSMCSVDVLWSWIGELRGRYFNSKFFNEKSK